MGKVKDIINEHMNKKTKWHCSQRPTVHLNNAPAGSHGLIKGEVVKIHEVGKFERLQFNMLNDKMLKKHGLKHQELPIITY